MLPLASPNDSPTEPTTNITVHIYDMTIHEAESRLVLADDGSEVAIIGSNPSAFAKV